MCRSQRGVNNDGDPYCNREENHSAVDIFLLSENRVKSMFAPEGPDGIDQEINRNWG